MKLGYVKNAVKKILLILYLVKIAENINNV